AVPRRRRHRSPRRARRSDGHRLPTRAGEQAHAGLFLLRPQDRRPLPRAGSRHPRGAGTRGSLRERAGGDRRRALPESRAGRAGGGAVAPGARGRRGGQPPPARLGGGAGRGGRARGLPPAARTLHRQRGDDRGGGLLATPARRRARGPGDQRRPRLEALSMAEHPSAILRRHGLRPKKSWGQNFLGDERHLAAIAAACELAPEDVVVEFGAGLGHLTRHLAETGARVIAVERDRELVPILRERLAGLDVDVREANAATFPLDEVAAEAGHKLVVVGNLPYHLSTEILFHVFDHKEVVARVVFLLQREVTERIA